MNHDYSSLRILYATNTRTDYLPPAKLSPNQVVCGPMWPTRRDSDGRFLSINTTFSYDLPELIATLPVEQRPDLVVVRTCAEMANAPRNLAAVGCPKVLLLADTHWQHNRRPIHTVISYVQSESYDHVVLLYDRHHAHWLHEAGVGSVHYLPGFEARPTVPEFMEERSQQVVFTGADRAGSNPRRQRLLRMVRERGFPVRMIPEMRIHSTAHFGDSLVTCHTSLNGELGIDVIEALGAGAFLLTDRLSSQSGLGELFTDGEHLVCYDSPDDLSVKVGYYLAHPEEALAIARRGHEYCRRHYSAERRAAELLELVFRGVAPAFDGALDPRARRDGKELMGRADLYDLFQIAQGEAEEVKVLLHGLSDPVSDLSDLPRVRLSLLAGSEPVAKDAHLNPAGANVALDPISPTEAQAQSWNALIVDATRPDVDPVALAQTYPCMVLVPYGATEQVLSAIGASLAPSGYRRGGQLPVFLREAAPARQAAWRWS